MKKLNLLLALLICITLLSCFEENVDFASAIQSDNQLPTPEAKFTINETDYSISIGYMTSAYDGTNRSRHRIILLNGALREKNWYGIPCEYRKGTNQSVIFNITSTSITELAEGTYTYELMTTESSLNETIISTNIVVGDNYCITSSNDIDEDQINSGSLTIQRSDDFYTIGDIQYSRYTLTYSFETLDYGTVSGSFVGVLQIINDLSD
tara:strand:- start:159 stop:785 length:627 start_codon:yes stop_codon:yes gene_type:complete